MINASIFSKVFGLYATEVWSMPERKFLEWLNQETVAERWEHKHNDIYACTGCGYKTHVDEVMGRPAYSFCPYCGRWMGCG